jgi:hypothetical protein
MNKKDDDADPSPLDDKQPEEEVRMTRFVLGEIRRYVMLTMGLFFLIAGMIVLPLPLPFGAAMILIGLSLLIINSKFARAKFLDLRARWTGMDNWLRSVEHRLPSSLRNAITPDDRDQGGFRSE